MGFDNDCIPNIQSLAGEYFCPVCHLLVYPDEALQTQCTHLYCKPCLTYVVSAVHACPYDGYRVTEADAKPLLESNKALADTIGKIQVHCLYYRTGCTWQGSLSDCKTHCSTCGFGESPVLCNRCGIQIVHRQVQEHAQSCSGVQSQAQQPGTQDATSTGAGATSDQSQAAAQTAQAGTPASQPQTSQTSAPTVSSQATNQPANSATQPQAAQAAVPTPEQWYQQQQQYQQQYQQYYQQYPGYDPYQQHYQYYYQYPQAAQQYQQQPTQGYPPQPHAQPQVNAQAQTQPQVQAQPQVQSHVPGYPQQQPQVPAQASQQPQPQVQPAVNIKPQAQPSGQAQPQMHAQSQGPHLHAPPYNQPQPLPQGQATQPHAQPHPVPQQQVQMPQYQQTHPQMHHPYPQPYPQSQSQQYPYPQPQGQVQPQPQPQPNLQAPVHPPSQPNQPHFPAQNAVTGYQSYPQPQQHPQAQGGAVQQMHATGAQQQPQYPGQVQGQFPPQASHVRPPQPYPAAPNQQQPVMLPAQGQAPSGLPAQQMPVYHNSQQAGYPFQQHPGVQAAQQAAPQQYAQQQPFPAQGPLMQAQLHAQGASQQNYGQQYGAQPNMAQNYTGRQMVPQGSQPYAQAAAGLAGAGHVRPTQQTQTYPMRTNSQLAVASEQQAVHQKSFKLTDGEKPHDQMLEKSIQDQDDRSKEATHASGKSGVEPDGMKKVKLENGLDEAADSNKLKQPLGPELKLVENGEQEGKPRIKKDTAEGTSEPSVGGKAGTTGGAEDLKKAEVQELKHPDNGKVAADIASQGRSSNSFPSVDQGRTQQQPMHFGPSADQRPGLPSISQSMPYPGNPQQSALMGHPSNQLRPQGPGQALPGPPSQGSFGRPSNVGHFQGHVPPYQAGQPHNPHGEPFVEPSFAAQRPGAFDSHGGMVGREPVPRPDVVEPRPPFPPVERRPGYFDGRIPDSHPRGPIERGPYRSAPPGVQPGGGRFGGPLVHDPMSAPGMLDERLKSFPEEHLKPFPHREFEDDLRKLPRASHLEAGPSKFGTPFPSSGPLDHSPHLFGVDGLPRPFERGPHGFDRDSGLKMDSGIGSGPSRFLPPFHANDIAERDRGGFPDDNMGRTDLGSRHGPTPGPGFGRHRMDGVPPRSPGGDYTGFPSRTFGAYRDVDGNESRSREGSKPYNFPAETFGKSIHDGRFPVPPSHLHRGELDIPGNMRVGDHLVGGPQRAEMLANHLRRGEHMGPRNMHLGEGAAFGPPGGLSRLGERPLARNFPHHHPFGESFGVEKPGHPLVGEPGFRSSYGFQRFAHDGGFYPGEMDPFDNPRKRRPGSIMCRICKVECGTVEGLDLHSQSREHQRKAMDMVLSIKQQNKKHKASNEEGRDGKKPKTSNFDARGKKR